MDFRYRTMDAPSPSESSSPVHVAGGSSCGRQLCILLGSRFRLKARNWGSTLLEVAVPILCGLILLLIYALASNDVTTGGMPTSSVPYNTNAMGVYYYVCPYISSIPAGCKPAEENNYCTQAILAVAPASGVAVDLFKNSLIATCNSYAKDVTSGIVSFSSSSAIDAYVGSNTYLNPDRQVYMSVVFDDATTTTSISASGSTSKVSFHIGGNVGSMSGDCNKLSNEGSNKGSSSMLLPNCYYHTNVYDNTGAPVTTDTVGGYKSIYGSAIYSMKVYIEMTIYGLSFGSDLFYMASMPTQDVVTNSFATVTAPIINTFFSLAFGYLAKLYSTAIATEKETRIVETFRMMGMNLLAYNGAWFISTILLMSVSATVITILPVWALIESGIVYCVLMTSMISVFAFSYLLTAFLSDPKTVGNVAYFLVFGMSFLSFAKNSNYSESYNLLWSFSPAYTNNCALSILVKYIGMKQNFTWATASKIVDGLSVGGLIGINIVWAMVFFILGVYFEQLFPGEVGVGRPWYYPFTMLYELFSGKQLDEELQKTLAKAGSDKDMVPIQANRAIQKHSVGADKVLVSIQNLKKTFIGADGAAFHAVDGISLDLYENELFTLLGHNGAGKTTTISMLTGLYEPTAGDALICGHSIKHDMDNVRRSIGMCPQHDVLIPEFTVREMLALTAGLKGVADELLQDEVFRMAALVGLKEKLDAASGELSGGQKRKLSVAIAFIGGSKVVFLDEPTSGMDVESKRAVWELMLQMKKGRTIVLTTHAMDEAELGERIAIMAKGGVRCCGDSLFLKDYYGVGYSFTVSLETAEGNRNVMADDKVMDNLAGLFSKLGTQFELVNRSGGELSYRLQFSSSHTFPALFDELDTQKKQWGIASYGIGVTTLTEVFLRVDDVDHDVDEGDTNLERHVGADGEEKHGDVVSFSRRPSITRAGLGKAGRVSDKKVAPMVVGGGASSSRDDAKDIFEVNWRDRAQQDDSAFAPVTIFFTVFAALMVKRWHNFKRDYKQIFFQVVFPSLLLVLAFTIFSTAITLTYPSRTLSPTIYPAPNNIEFGRSSTVSAAELDAFRSLVLSGEGTTSVPPTSAFDPASTVGMKDDSIYRAWETYLLKTINSQGTNVRTGSFFMHKTASNTKQIYAFFNTTASVDSGQAYSSLFFNMKLRSLTGSTQSTIDVVSSPLPNLKRVAQQTLLILTFIFVCTAFSMIPQFFALFIAKEKKIKAKHLQMISGVSHTAYWLAALCWDLCNFFVPMTIFFICIGAFNVEYLMGENFGPVFLGNILYGLAQASQCYFLVVLFNIENGETLGSVLTILVNFTTSLGYSLVVMLLNRMFQVSKDLSYLWRFLFPSFAWGEIHGNALVGKPLYGLTGSVWDWNFSGNALLFLFIDFVFYFGGVILMEYLQSNKTWQMALEQIYLDVVSFLCSPCVGSRVSPTANVAQISPDAEGRDRSYEMDAENANSLGEDSDVFAERNRIARGDVRNDYLTVKGLSKNFTTWYGASTKKAVQNVSFGIPKGQCFGFLGVNGAGKTTTMRIITGDELPTSGTATVDKYDILSDHESVRQLIGYCPQFDAIFPSMTGREHLELYARINLVPAEKLDHFVTSLLQRLTLEEHADKPAGSYSGGNKRKLSVGIALIGNPPIVFLDEPSTGVDPKARRFMWQLISSTMKSRAVVLTTHMMEECEALCSRIGIMVDGQIACLGSSQHLKSKFGDGFQFDIKMKDNLVAADSEAQQQQQQPATVVAAPEVAGLVAGKKVNPTLVDADLKAFLTQNFPTHKVLEQHGTNYKVSVKRNPQLSTGQMFKLFEEEKDRVRIAAYSISETDLEQIFMQMAAKAEEFAGKATYG